MPFTLSHPSAALPVWPLVRRGLVPLAPFVIGAMVPDFEYLWRLEPFAQVSHSARGILTFCLPVGVAVLLAWELGMGDTARGLVGMGEATRSTARTPRGLTLALLALTLGSVSHVSWDAFTHRDTIGPVLVPALRHPALTLAGVEIPWYNVLQVASSLVGGAMVLGWLWRRVERDGAGWRALLAGRRRWGWAMIVGGALVVAAWNAPRRGEMTGASRAKIVLGRAVVGGLAGATLALTALTLLQRTGRWNWHDAERDLEDGHA